jgi:hypothetical protein
MKCNICDASLSEPKFIPGVKGSFDPCDKCMEVIEDTLASYEDAPHLDKPSADEKDLGGPDPVFEDIYPQAYDPFGTEN